jgi:hypothetical protein
MSMKVLKQKTSAHFYVRLKHTKEVYREKATKDN